MIDSENIETIHTKHTLPIVNYQKSPKPFKTCLET